MTFSDIYMEIFNSDIASISYFEDLQLMRTSWKNCDGADDFMTILSQVQDFYELLLPKKTLWDQSRFNYYIPPALQVWTDENINIPAQKLNVIEKVSFLVSKDAMSQMSINKIFDETESEFLPRFFVDEKEGMAWLQKPINEQKNLSLEPPSIIIDRKKDKILLSVEIETEEFNEYFKLFSKLRKARLLSIELADRFLTLTKQERTISKLLIKGKSNDYISDILSISPHTVQTHRKRIYRKLGCKRVEDLMKYNMII